MCGTFSTPRLRPGIRLQRPNARYPAFFSVRSIPDVFRQAHDPLLIIISPLASSHSQRPHITSAVCGRETRLQMSAALMNLAGLVVETLLYGIYLVLFLTSTYLLVGRYKSSRTSWKYVPLLRSMVFLSGFCLFAAVSGVRRNIPAIFRTAYSFLPLRFG
jgi:hypothetical protein